MKFREFILAVAGVAAIASCARVSDVTEITGQTDWEGVENVRITIGKTVDTLVPVVDGKFNVSLPADLLAIGYVSADGANVPFVSDGTPLEVSLIENDVKITSAYPEHSVHERFVAYQNAEHEYYDEYARRHTEINSDSLMTDAGKQAAFEAFSDEFFDRYNAFNEKTVAENPDNVIAFYALQSLLGQCDDEQMLGVIETLAPALQEEDFVKRLKGSIEARKETAEGSMFKDFTVEHVYGYDRSIDPQPLKKEVRFSDYVGKGTYVLVDFWSPWCGPCRREVPNIVKVYEEYKDKGLEVLSLAVWEKKPQSHTIEVAGQLGMDWLHINNCGSVPTDIYGVDGIPHLMLIGPDGTILKRGFHGLEGIREAVAEYIK